MRSTLRDAADALQLADHHVVHEERELLRRLSRRDRGVGENRKPGDVDAPNQGLVDAARQIGANARDRRP